MGSDIRRHAAELLEAERRERLGDEYRWHPDDSRVNSRHYPQVYEPPQQPKGKRRKVILTPVMREAIDRKVRAIRAAGTVGFRVHFREFCEALGHGVDSSAGRQQIKKYLRERGAMDVVYSLEDQMWTGDV